MINFLIYIFILFFSSLNGMTNFDSAEAKAILQQIADLTAGENGFSGKLQLANVDGNIAGFSYQSKDGEIKNITINLANVDLTKPKILKTYTSSKLKDMKIK